MPVHRDLSFVQHRPQLESLDDIGRFLALLRFEQRGKLDQFDFQLGNLNKKTG
jgi:hypothetical protein